MTDNAKPVRLQDILDALEWQQDECHAFLELATGHIVVINEDDQFAVEQDDSKLPEWQRESESLALARRMAENGGGVPDGYVALPDRFDIDEYRMMERFSWSRADDEERDELSRAIQGSGAFRRFRDTVHRLGIEKEWYGAREEGYREVAIEWCEEHGIPYLEEAKMDEKG